MTFDETSRISRILHSVMKPRAFLIIFVGFIVVVTVVSVGMAAAVGAVLGTDTAAKLGQTGQIFEAIAAAFSGLAFVALVVTFLLQLEELRLQRTELENQRQEMSRTQAELHRSAEADIRNLHVELIKLGIQDKSLGDVWPDPAPSTPHEFRRQLWYANLIYQHQRLAMELGSYSDAQVRAMLQLLFRSPLMRAYWEETAEFRGQALIPQTSEWLFARIADEIVGGFDGPSDNGLRLAE